MATQCFLDWCRENQRNPDEPGAVADFSSHALGGKKNPPLPKWTIIRLPPNIDCGAAYHVDCPEEHVLAWARHRWGGEYTIVLAGHLPIVRWGGRRDMVPTPGNSFLGVQHWGLYADEREAP